MSICVTAKQECNCDACTIALGGEYELRGSVVQRDNRIFIFHDWHFCEDCYTRMQKRGWMSKEYKGKLVALLFKDGCTVELSRERYAHIERGSWKRIKDQAVYFSNVKSSLVHLVKIYSRPGGIEGTGNGTAKIIAPYQLRML